jgi:hypothetical protein
MHQQDHMHDPQHPADVETVGEQDDALADWLREKVSNAQAIGQTTIPVQTGVALRIAGLLDRAATVEART